MGNNNLKHEQQCAIRDAINLLPCPFCGSKAEKRERTGISDYDYDKVYYDIRCTNNECYLQDGAEWNCKTYDEVVEMWNKRQ
jgi:hypothetical protein